MSKYNAKKINIDGHTFDSTAEGYYYEYLKQLKAENKIINFELQPKYKLMCSFIKGGKKHREINYIADFLVYHTDGSEEVIDIKGLPTEVAKIKRKMFDYKYRDLKITWLCRSKKYSPTGWIEYEELKRLRRGKNERKGREKRV